LSGSYESAKRFELVFGPGIKYVHRHARELVEPDAGFRVLEIGCGTALQLVRYRGDGRRLVGVDLDPGMLMRARENLVGQGDLVLGDGGRLPFDDGSFDLLLACFTLHEMPTETRRSTLAEARRVLGPGGRVLLTDFSARGDLGFGGRFYQLLIKAIEASVGGDHYRGYKDYMARGGLPPLIEEAGFSIERSSTIGRGAIDVLLLSPTSSRS
jgi:ubiquinone/menaquinone biosynthesis C-methylase UbiE